MQLIILGSNVANAIKSAIAPKVDNVNISTYASMNDFASETELRSVICDRIILTEEAVTGNDANAKRTHLYSFKEFLYSRYPDVTVITISKEKETLDLCADVFCDDNNTNIWITGKVKPACMIALADSPISELEEMFGESTARGLQRQEELRYQEEIRQAQNDPTFAVSSEFNPAPVEEEPQPAKKKGLFSGFGGKKQHNQPAAPAPSNEPVVNPLAASKRKKPAGFGGGNSNPEPVSEPSMDSPPFDAGFNDFDFESEPAQTDDETYFEDASSVNNNSGFEAYNDSFDDNGTLNDDFGDSAPMPDMDFTDSFDSYSTNDTSVNDSGFNDIDVSNEGNVQNMNNDMDSPSFDMDFDDFGDMGTDNTNNGFTADTYMGPSNQQSTPQKSQSLVRRDNGENLRTANTQMDMDMDFSSVQAYEEARRPVKVVEKEVVKEVVREVRVPSNVNVQQVGGASKYQNILNGNVNQIFVITGDRRSGVTKTSLTIASKFGVKVPTLYVDMDLDRHGSLYYLSVEDLADSETSVQNGLGLIKSGRDIKRYAFRSANYPFDSLVTMPGNSIADDSIREAMSQLIYQSKMYNVVVVDCPLDKIYLMEEMMYTADFVICVDSDICACSNTLFTLDALQMSKAPAGKGVNDKALTMLYNRSKFLVKVTEPKNDIINNMHYLEQIYGLSDDRFNWARLSYYQGTMENIDVMLQGLI